jgi:hypothetical protein
MTDDTLAAYLAEHPKTTGVLWTLLTLLTQAGTVAASDGGYIGP